MNAILEYRRETNGHLTYVASFWTGGRGVANPGQIIGPNDADRDLITNPAHTLLFAVNPGSDTIAVFQINSNGSLTAIKGSPFPSGGINPVSLGLVDNQLYVVNKNQDPDRPNSELPNYTGFRVAGNGNLNPIPHSTIALPTGDAPTLALISPGGDLMFGFRFFPGGLNGTEVPRAGAVESFHILPNGRLEAAARSPKTVPTTDPPSNSLVDLFGLPSYYDIPLNGAVHPTQPILYVNLVTYTQIGVYTYDKDGVLNYVRSVGNTGVAPCWDAISKDGQYMYVVDAFSNSVSTYDLADPLNPTEIQSVTLSVGGGAFRISLDPGGKYVYIVDQNLDAALMDTSQNNIQVLQIQPDGTLAQVPGATITLPIPPFARAQGVLSL